jgi:hypothetical protein
VGDDAPGGGDGSGRSPYNNLPDAVAAARVLSQTVVIKVEPGDYPLAAPLVIDTSLEFARIDRAGGS